MAEEQDDDSVVDSWEDFEENPDFLEKQLKRLALNNRENAFTGETVIVNEEEALRSSTLIAQEPKIMILRRPQNNMSELTEEPFSLKNKIPLKSLKQRQAEYAEARLRILGNSGSASEAEELQKMNGGLDVSLLPSCSTNLNTPENSQLVTGSCTGFSKPVTLIKPSSVSVIRLPRSPGCQPGFQDRIKSDGAS